MRRFLCLVFSMILLFSFSVQTFASSAQSVQIYSSIASDGSCMVTVNLTLNLDSKISDLTFPLPNGASNASVNGTSARIYTEYGVNVISLSKAVSGYVGSVSVSIHYSLSNVLSKDDNNVVSTELELLSGFSLPIEYMEFKVTFPSDLTYRPDFSDTYLQESLESILTYSYSGSTISGITMDTLKDHDTVHLSVQTEKEMFPDSLYLKNISPWTQIAMIVAASLAILVWILFLRCFPILPQKCTGVPNLINAGDVGSILSYQGTDFPLMIVSWAQMGYLRIVGDNHGRIVLEKRMDMGNERNLYEIKIFNALFKVSNTVDTSKRKFALLNDHVHKNKPSIKKLYKIRPDFIRVYCILFLFVAFFGGLALSNALFISGIRMILWSVFFSLLCVLLGYLIQIGIANLFSYHTDRKILCLLSILSLFIIGCASNQLVICLFIIVSQIFAGMTGPYCGIRNATGKRLVSELYGLRSHLYKLRKKEYSSFDNPDYFYQMIPYAIALGVDSDFAKYFSDYNLPDCTFIQLSNIGHLNANQFTSLLKDILSSMDERRKNLFLERFFKK